MHINKTKIISTVVSVAVSTLLVASAVFAVTTISQNLATEGTLAVTGTSTLTGAVTTAGNVTLGDAAADTTIINSRVATGAVGGSEISLSTAYTYGEGLEMRYGVDSWAGILGSFKGYYFRTEGNVGHATYGLRGMEVYTALDIDTGTTGIGSLTGLYSELLVKAPATSYTIAGYPNALEATFDYEAATAGTTTITNGVAAIVAKIQTATGLASYTNLDGIRIIGRDADAVRVMGDALAIENDAVGSHATWTNAIHISAGATNGINMSGAAITTDLTLQNGETIDNDTDNVVKITSPALVQAYDAAAYWTSTQADAGGVTFDSTSDGTASFTFSDPVVLNGRLSTGSVTGAALTIGATYDKEDGTRLIYDVSDWTGKSEFVGFSTRTGVTASAASKTVYGAKLHAANAPAGAASGYNVGTLRGAYIEAETKPGAATIDTMRGLEVVAGISATNTAVTSFQGIRLNMITDTPIGTGYGLVIRDEPNVGGEALAAAIYVENWSPTTWTGYTYGLDFSGAKIGTADIRLQNGATISNADTHLNIKTNPAIYKTIRLNSQSYDLAGANETIIGFQSKPRANLAGGTVSVTGAELEPGFNNGVAGTNLIGVASRPTLKGTTGNLAGVVRAFEGSVGSDAGSTRTVAGPVSVLKAFNNMDGTVTNGVFVIDVETNGDVVPWSGLALLPDNNTIASDSGTLGTQLGWIKVKVGTATLYIPLYTTLTP